MKIERFPLQDRLALLDTGRCAHPEYAAAIIHRFADMTLPEYFQSFEAELERLRSTLGLSRERVQSMTYKQLAKALDDRLSVTPSCGDAYLYDAAALLLPPLLGAPPEQTGQEEAGAPPLGQPLLPPRSLEERLKASLTPRDCVLVDMEAGSLIRFMDELVAPCAAEFTAIYEQYFQQYGNKTVSELAADYVAMPEAERQTVLYELLIHPFASLEEHPNKRYCP